MLINEISFPKYKTILLIFSLICSSASADENLDLFERITGITPQSKIISIPLKRGEGGHCLKALISETGENLGPRVLINKEYWKQLPKQTQQRIVMHELGHCEVGLRHSGNPGDIMYYETSSDILNQKDFNKVLEEFALLVSGKEID